MRDLASGDDRHPSRVLVVDDSDIALEIVREGLTSRGFIVAEASDGVQALELARTWQPDVVVCDLHMPGMDGTEVLARLAEIDRLMPVIMLSADGDLSGTLRNVHPRVFDYVQKGSDTRALSAAVTRAANHVRIVRDNERLSAELLAADEELERRVRERTRMLESANDELMSRLRRLEETQEKLVDATRKVAFGMLVAGISHELNNPMSIILGYAQSELRRLLPDDPRRHSLEIIERNALRCGEVVKALQGVAPRARAPRVAVESSLLISQSIELAAPIARARGISLEPAPCAADLPLVFVCIEEIESAILNLIHNGIEASRENGTLHVRAAASSREGTTGVEIAIADEGAGIPAADLGRLFQPFFTTKSPSKVNGKSPGIGLSLARCVVEAHAGTVAIDSVPGTGTTARIWLPAFAPSDASAPPDAA